MRFTMPSRDLRQMLRIPSAISDTAVIEADMDGLRINVVDVGHIMMAGLTVPASALSGYEDPATCTADIKKLMTVTSLAEASEDITVSTDDASITLHFGNLTRTCGLLTEGIHPRVPGIELPVCASVPSDVLLDALKAVGDIGDLTRITAGNGTVLWEGSEDTDSAEYRALCAVDGEGRSSYPTQYLSLLAKMMPRGADVTIHMGAKMPIRLDWTDGPIQAWAMLQPSVSQDD